jgi:pilus assembly protein Flp/PilA
VASITKHQPRIWSKNVLIDHLGPMHRIWVKLVAEEQGVTAIEYGLLAALISVVCIAAFKFTGTSLSAMYTMWSSAVIAALASAT